MANFIYLKSLGYVDVDDVIQVYDPDGRETDLIGERPQELAVRFGAEVYDRRGGVSTRVVLIRDPADIDLLIGVLGLQMAPREGGDLRWFEKISRSVKGTRKVPAKKKSAPRKTAPKKGKGGGA